MQPKLYSPAFIPKLDFTAGGYDQRAPFNRAKVLHARKLLEQANQPIDVIEDYLIALSSKRPQPSEQPQNNSYCVGTIFVQNQQNPVVHCVPLLPTSSLPRFVMFAT